MRRSRRILTATAVALSLSVLIPAVALAHPLGNFTINHYAGIRVSADEIQLDVVIDRAEIPTFQERLRLDGDSDGELAPAEEEVARDEGCRSLAASLTLRVAGAGVQPRLVATGMQFPTGAAGLSTMRLVCVLRAPLPAGIGEGVDIEFTDTSFPDRLGWREIVAEGDGVTVESGGTALPATVSGRLTAYPEAQLQTPLAMREARLRVTPGGTRLPPFMPPDAQPIAGDSGASPRSGVTAVVPGGVGADIPAVFRATDVSPGVLLLAIATALALGAGHALTPGHGKTLMAAYLVGTRGSVIHAVGLGLSVTVSHTLGILVLAALVVAMQGAVAPDVVVRWTPLIAALTIVAIGAWMVVTEVRRRTAAHRRHGHNHHHASGLAHDHGREQAHDHQHGEGHPREHSHGGVRHSHAPAEGATITWRSLFALGLAGGIIPSTSALLILLGTIAAGQAAFGLLLVIVFGLGMALVLIGVGVLLVRSRGLLDRLTRGSHLGSMVALAPLAAAVLVLGIGILLTGQAMAGGTSL